MLIGGSGFVNEVRMQLSIGATADDLIAVVQEEASRHRGSDDRARSLTAASREAIVGMGLDPVDVAIGMVARDAGEYRALQAQRGRS
jgi:hypothetical protein